MCVFSPRISHLLICLFPFGLIHSNSSCVPAVVQGPCGCWQLGIVSSMLPALMGFTVQSPLFPGASMALSAGCVCHLESTTWGAKLFATSFCQSIQRLKARFWRSGLGSELLSETLSLSYFSLSFAPSIPRTWNRSLAKIIPRGMFEPF